MQDKKGQVIERVQQAGVSKVLDHYNQTVVLDDDKIDQMHKAQEPTQVPQNIEEYSERSMIGLVDHRNLKQNEQKTKEYASMAALRPHVPADWASIGSAMGQEAAGMNARRYRVPAARKQKELALWIYICIY